MIRVGKVKVCFQYFRYLFVVCELLSIVTGNSLENRFDRNEHFNQCSSNHFSMLGWYMLYQREFGLSVNYCDQRTDIVFSYDRINFKVSDTPFLFNDLGLGIGYYAKQIA